MKLAVVRHSVTLNCGQSFCLYLNYGFAVGIAKEEDDDIIASAGDYVLMQIAPTTEVGSSDSRGSV